MASLNTLRTRGSVIVSIVIGIALCAFLLGDFMSSGEDYMSANKMEIGEINGETIGYLEYGSLADKYTEIVQVMMGKETLTNEEYETARNLAWEDLLAQYSYEPGFEKLGLSLGDAEQLDMVSGAYVSPVMSSFFANQETGAFDPMMVKNFVSSLDMDQTGRARVMWGYLQDQMNSQRQMSKYISIVKSGIYVTDVEIDQAVVAANSTYSARYITQDYASIADSTIKVSDSEIKKYYSVHENMFKQDESRNVEYVVFDILPSTQDYDDAAKYIADIAAEFSVSENPMQYATLNSYAPVDNRYYKETELESAIATALYNSPDSIYGPVLSGDKYIIARLSDMKNLPDTLGAKHILLASTDQKLADSLVVVINKGGDFAALSREFSLDQNANKNGGDIGTFAPEQMIPEFSDACIVESVGNIFTVTSSVGIHVVELTKKTPSVSKAQIATITYDVVPSDDTQKLAYGEASLFVESASESHAAFKTAIVESALSMRLARVRNTDRNIPGFDQAGELVRWAFNEDKGTVSQIMEIDDSYVVAVLSDISEKGISPINNVVSSIRAILVKEKKAELIKQNLKGSSLDAIATSIDTEVKDIKDLKFATFYVDGIGFEPALVGAICGGANKGVISQVVDGAEGVYIFDINNVATTEEATKQSEKVFLEANAQNFISERVGAVLQEKSNVSDLRVKFF